MPNPPNCKNAVQDTVNWVSAFIVQRPFVGVGGVANEPALTSANLTAQTILAAPFGWSWNRASKQFNTIIGQSDYQISIPDFGWLEQATVYIASGNPPTFQLEIAKLLAVDGQQSRPFRISPVLDDNTGNITFRLFSVPDLVYQVALTYQKAPPVLTLAGSWAPIPDKYAFLYERSMLAHAHAMYDSQLYALELQIFFRQLVGAAEGLTESEKAIFLEEAFRRLRAEEVAALSPQQGRQSRL